MITDSDIKHIARLSNLEIAENEIESLEELRLDEVKPSLSQNEAIKNAPKKRAGGFSVPAVIE